MEDRGGRETVQLLSTRWRDRSTPTEIGAEVRDKRSWETTSLSIKGKGELAGTSSIEARGQLQWQ